MHLREILTEKHTAFDAQAGSKKRALELVSTIITEDNPDLDASEVFDNLISRERLGSTGIGHGIAIPHGRIKNISEVVGALVKLETGVDFDAADDEPVDLMFALLVPEQATEQHLEILALLARMFSDADVRRRLRSADSGPELYRMMVSYEDPDPDG